MALVTVQRSPTPSNSSESTTNSEVCCIGDSFSEFQTSTNQNKCLNRSISFSESYFAIKGAALILPQSECTRRLTNGSHGDIEAHLQSMFHLIRPQDTLKMAVKLESSVCTERVRYLAVVSTVGRDDTDESIILGVDIVPDGEATIGLVLPLFSDLDFLLDGEGGFSVTTNHTHHMFKPVSVQTMWSAIQCISKIQLTAVRHNYHARGLTHTWSTYYEGIVRSTQSCVNEWNTMEDISFRRSDPARDEKNKSSDDLQMERSIKQALRDVMARSDLESVTVREIKQQINSILQIDLRPFRSLIDSEMMIVLGQFDCPSRIFDYLYLGSEYNACDLEHLNKIGVGYILNITREIDNFFPELFEYYNVREYDVPETKLLKYWEDTHRFIKMARERKSCVLVHCRKGISRSASTVIAYCMKEYGWNLDKALSYTQDLRSCVRPNPGFMQQLATYQGILDASKQRHSDLWSSSSSLNSSVPAANEALMENKSQSDTAQTSKADRTNPSSTVDVPLLHTDPKTDQSQSGAQAASLIESSHPGFDWSRCSSLPPDLHLDPDAYYISSDSEDSLPDPIYDTFTGNTDNVELLSISVNHPSPSEMLSHDNTTKYSSSFVNHSRNTQDHLFDLSSCPTEDLVYQTSSCLGFYDVEMLPSFNGLEPCVKSLDDPCNDSPEEVEETSLHPDLICESLRHRQKKLLRTAQTLWMSDFQKPDHESLHQVTPRITELPPVEDMCPDSGEKCELSSSLGAAKLKDDGSWIRFENNVSTNKIFETPENSKYCSQETLCTDISVEADDLPTNSFDKRPTDNASFENSLKSSPADSPVKGSLFETDVSQVSPGIVRRTREEIEQRFRAQSESSTVNDNCKSVQRAASLKTERPGVVSSIENRFDRNSERRRTCPPLMRTENFALRSGGETQGFSKRTKTQRDCESDSTGSLKSVHLENEEISLNMSLDDLQALEVTEGLVKRNAQNYEVLSMAGTPPEVPSHDVSPHLESQLSIKTGLVKKQTEELKLRRMPEIHSLQNDSKSVSELGDINMNNRNEAKIETSNSPFLTTGTPSLLPSPLVSSEIRTLDPEVSKKLELTSSKTSDIPLYRSEEILWQSGTVKQHKEALEVRLDTACNKSLDTTPTNLLPLSTDVTIITPTPNSQDTVLCSVESTAERSTDSSDINYPVSCKLTPSSSEKVSTSVFISSTSITVPFSVSPLLSTSPSNVRESLDEATALDDIRVRSLVSRFNSTTPVTNVKVSTSSSSAVIKDHRKLTNRNSLPPSNDHYRDQLLSVSESPVVSTNPACSAKTVSSISEPSSAMTSEVSSVSTSIITSAATSAASTSSYDTVGSETPVWQFKTRRKLQGSSHPLTKLVSKQADFQCLKRPGRFYSTM